MKRYISIFLVVIMILGNFSSEMVHAVSNYVDITESISEELNIDEDVSNSEENENIDVQQEDDSLSKNLDESESTDLEEDNTNSENKDVDIEDFSTEAIVDTPSTYDINNPITYIHKTTQKSVRSLSKALADLKDLKGLTGEVEIRFDHDYTIGSAPEDFYFIEQELPCDRIIFTAPTGAKVTVTKDLQFNDYNYQPSSNSEKVITFENIKLNFTGEHSIFANGTVLHMGEGVEMVGSSPKIFMGSNKSGSNINAPLNLYIQSGKYSEISASSGDNGRNINSYATLHFYGGYAKNIFSGENNKHTSSFYVHVYGGEIDEVIDRQKNNALKTPLYLTIRKKATIKRILNVKEVTIGDYVNNYPNPGIMYEGELIVTEKMILDGGIGMYDNSVLEIKESVPSVYASNFWYKTGCTIRIPGNRSKDNVPLVLRSGINSSNDPINFELSSKIKEEEFYLMKAYDEYNSAINLARDNFVIKEKEYFYLDEIEREREKPPGGAYDLPTIYLKAKAKEEGPLIYNSDSNEFSYIDRKGNENKAWWIDNKIKNSQFNFNNLNYNDLAEAEHYYVLAPTEITLKITGKGSNRTLKFDNNRDSDRPINVEFEDLDAVDSEFVLKNIKSINIKGHNSINQTTNGKTALTYSFSGSNKGVVSLASEDSSFVVYDKSSNSNKYTIKDNIIDDGNTSDAAIVKMSFEESVSVNNTNKPKGFKLEPINANSNSTTRKFSTKDGYDKLTLLLPGDGKDYLLKEDNNLASNIPYYYQGQKIEQGYQNQSGPVNTKFTLTANSKNDYYQVNKKPRIHVIAVKSDKPTVYYLANTLEECMKNYVDNIGSTHEVIFLGDYEINSQNDVDAIKNYGKDSTKNTNGITFKTKTDGWKYTLKVNIDIELKKGSGFGVTFDDIRFEYLSEDKWIYANGRTLKFGDRVEMLGNKYPSVSAGQNPSSKSDRVNNEANITINSGTYKDVTGDRCNSVQNTKVTINNGEFKGKVSGLASTTSNTNSNAPESDRINNVKLIINNGTFKSDVYGINTGSNANGTLTMTIEGGTFEGPVVAVDGRVNQDSTVTIKNGTFNSEVYGTSASSNIETNLNIIIENVTFNKTFTGLNGGTVNSATLTVKSGNFKKFFYGVSSNNSVSNSQTDLKSNLNITIENGIFEDDVNGANSGLSRGNITMEILAGTFKGNVFGTQTKIDTLNMTIRGGDFVTEHRNVRGNNTTNENDKTNNVIFEISGGTFAWDVYGAYRAENITMNISNGTFRKQVANYHVDNVVMEISGGEFNDLVTGNKLKTQSDTTVEMNIAGGDFKNVIYASVGAGTTNVNVSGGKFNTKLVGNENTDTNNVTININGDVTIPRITHYDKLVVGETKKAVLEITEGMNIVQNKETELVIKRESKVKLEGNNQHEVKKLTIEGDRNTLALNLDRNPVPLVVTGEYAHKDKKLKLELIGNKTNNKQLIKFSKFKADVNNFDFTDTNYYIKEVANNNETIITLCEKLSTTNLHFKLDVKASTLQYSFDGRNFSDAWWYIPDLKNSNITFTKDNLLYYKGINIFKNIDNIANWNKVFEITNTANDKNILFDLGEPLNFDVKLTDVNLTNSRLELKKLRHLEISGSNSISEKAGETNPTFSYEISGEVKTTDDASKLIVYSYNSNEGIKSLNNKQGYGVKIIFDESFANPKSIKLKNIKNNNIDILLDMKDNYQNASLLVSKNYANETYNLIDTSDKDKVYYSEDSNTNNITYNITMDNKGKTYNVSNKPFIEIKEENNFVTIKKNMEDVITYINKDTNKNSKNYTLTFINNYRLNASDLDKWKAWDNEVGSMKITTNYEPLSKKYLLTIDSDLVLPNLEYKTTFEDVKLKFTNSNTWIYANGGDLVFGTGVDIEGQNYPSVSAGRPSTPTINKIDNAKLTIKSGTFNNVTGDCHNSVKNTTVTIDGGTFNEKVYGTNGIVDNNVEFIVNNGNFNNEVYGVATGSEVKGTLTMTIYNGTFKKKVAGTDGRVGNDVVFTIKKGTFDDEVYGVATGSEVKGTLTMTIDDGTFNKKVYGTDGIVDNDVLFIIKKGTFNDEVFGLARGSNVNGKLEMAIENGNFNHNVIGTVAKVNTLDMTISGGHFVQPVRANNTNENNKTNSINLEISGGTFALGVHGANYVDNINIDISEGTFNWNVYGASYANDVTMKISNGTFGGPQGQVSTATGQVEKATMEISGGVFNDAVTGSKASSKSEVKMNITGGDFRKRIYGSVGSGTTKINISGGKFADWIVGNSNKNNVTVNINNTITVPRIEHYDELVVGEGAKATLEITQEMQITPNKENEIVIKNGSEVKLTGNNKYKVNKLTSEGPGNILTLHMNKDTAPLEVTSAYDNTNSDKLTLNAIRDKDDNKKLIEFLGGADVNSFNLNDTDYYIREISKGSGNVITLYKKLEPNKLKFELDPSATAPSLKYSIDDKPLENVWWYENNLTATNIDFTEGNLFKYKGMDIFKDVKGIPNGKVFEITNTGSDKIISVDLGQGSDFDFKLKNVTLNTSKVNVENIKHLIIEGDNSISANSTNVGPVFSYDISGQVKAINNSYLKIFANEATIDPFNRKDGGAIDFKFYKPFNSNSQSTSNKVRLVEKNTTNKLEFNIPDNTQRLGILLGNSNNNKTYNLYHGDLGDTGNSVYVAGNTEQTFKESFDTNSSYEYVRRAKPVNRVNINVPKNVSFNVNVPADQLDAIKPDNWDQYFIATDLEVKNDSLRVKDEFIDENGKTHHFGKINSDLELGYLGVNSSNTTKDGIELVSNTQLDPVITNSPSGVKLALKLLKGTDEISLDESVVSTTPSKTWTILANSIETLKIEPNFNSNNNNFFNVSATSPRIIDSKHNLRFRFNINTP